MPTRAETPSLEATVGPERRAGLEVLTELAELDEQIRLSSLAKGISLSEAQTMIAYGRLRLACNFLAQGLNNQRSVRLDYLFEEDKLDPMGFVMESEGTAFTSDHPEVVEDIIRGMYRRVPRSNMPVLSKDGRRVLNTLNEAKGVIFTASQNSIVRILR